MPSNRFDRGERLKSRKVIQRLFAQGNSFVQYPLRLIWLRVDEPLSEFPVQLALSVPKRNFRKAVQRNRIRRQVREAYRLQKNWLYRSLKGTNGQLTFMVIYIAREPLPYHQIAAAMQVMMHRFVKKYRKQSNNHERG